MSQHILRLVHRIPYITPNSELSLYFLSSFLLYSILYIIAKLCPKLFPLSDVYETLKSADEKCEWNSRLISNVHAIIAIIGNAYVIATTDYFGKDGFHVESPLGTALECMSAGYLAYDAVLVVRHSKQLGSNGTTLTHHCVGLGAIWISISHGAGQFWIVAFLMTEATTPLVNTRWFLDRAGQKTSLIYYINGAGMCLGFWIVRLPAGICVLYHAYRYQTELRELPTGILCIVWLLFISLNLLNVYWTIIITQGLLKVVRGRIKRKA